MRSMPSANTYTGPDPSVCASGLFGVGRAAVVLDTHHDDVVGDDLAGIFGLVAVPVLGAAVDAVVGVPLPPHADAVHRHVDARRRLPGERLLRDGGTERIDGGATILSAGTFAHSAPVLEYRLCGAPPRPDRR